MAKRNIPVDLFYASDTGDCTYELNSRRVITGPVADKYSSHARGLNGLPAETATLQCIAVRDGEQRSDELEQWVSHFEPGE